MKKVFIASLSFLFLSIVVHASVYTISQTGPVKIPTDEISSYNFEDENDTTTLEDQLSNNYDMTLYPDHFDYDTTPHKNGSHAGYIANSGTSAQGPTTLMDSDARTVNAWVYPNNVSAYDVFFSSASGDSGIQLRFGDTSSGCGSISFQYFLNGNNIYSTGGSNYPVCSGEWSMVTWAWDNNGIDMYVDGNLHDSSNENIYRGWNSPGISLGNTTYDDGSITYYYDGYMDDITFYSTRKNDTEVEEIYNQQK